MGLSNFGSPADGVLPMLVMNTVMSVVLVKNKIRSILGGDSEWSRARRVSITRYASLCRDRSRCIPRAAECCVCLNRFEADDQVSELSCNHFFHKPCLDKWFDNHHISCPLCRSLF